jgi:hypothetical protein
MTTRVPSGPKETIIFKLRLQRRNPRPPASLRAHTFDPYFSAPILSAEQTQRIDLETIAAFEQPAQMSSVGSESWDEHLACPNSDYHASFSLEFVATAPVLARTSVCA